MQRLNNTCWYEGQKHKFKKPSFELKASDGPKEKEIA